MLIIPVINWLEATHNYKAMSALIPSRQRKAVLLDNKPLEDVDKLEYIRSIFVANGQGTEEIRTCINFARSASSRLQPRCLFAVGYIVAFKE